ncbi:hypothetical protein AVEN_189636-1, partial [Araneus ventricosus]
SKYCDSQEVMRTTSLRCQGGKGGNEDIRREGGAFPDSNFSLQQSCSANLQACGEVDTARVQA